MRQLAQTCLKAQSAVDQLQGWIPHLGLSRTLAKESVSLKMMRTMCQRCFMAG